MDYLGAKAGAFGDTPTMTLTLRPYQQEAVQAIYDHFGSTAVNRTHFIRW